MTMVVKPPLDEALLAHYGIKGMKWGVRKERTPEQQIAKLTKKINRMDADRHIEGVSLRGWALKKQHKKMLRKDPKFSFKKLSSEEQERYQKRATRRVKRSIYLRGASEAALIVGGAYGLAKVTNSSPQATTGATVSAIMLAGNIGYMRAQQITAVNKSVKWDKLQKERRELGYKPD